MGEQLIKPYEISVWEDKLIQDGAEYRFIENKLAVIGSDTMTGLNRVYDPVFNKKTNGEKTLSFSLKYKYFDPYSGNSDFVNPFAALLTNERKVKLHYDGEWYEFIVKDHSESSDELTWTYTCSDAFVLELSKQGYNLTFDTELNNNQGTATELVKKTIENTDWQLGEVNVGKQLVAEPIYKAILYPRQDIVIINANGNTDPIPTTQTNIYLFYTYVKNKSGKYVQFIIRDDNRQYTIDDKNVITDTNYRIINELKYNETNQNFTDEYNNIIIQLDNNISGQAVDPIETRYQANRLIYNQKTTYDPVMQRTVDLFQINGGERKIYRYIDYTYTTSDVITNYITNGDNFNALEDGSMQGWNPYVDIEAGKTVQKLELITKPELKTGSPLATLNSLSEIEGYLKVHFAGELKRQNNKLCNTIYNSGITYNSSFLKSISKGDKFVFRWRARSNLNSYSPVQNLGLIIAKYTQDEATPYGYYYKHIDSNNIILQFEGVPTRLDNIITGGTIESRTGTNGQDYVIDGVVQIPSTKYIYKVGNNSYVWNGTTQRFDSLGNNYIPYYYLTATALKSVPESALSDSSQKYGIFIYEYGINSEVTYYIQDIQLTRFLPDGVDSTGQTPVLIGNIPVATSNPTEYYYIQPSEGAAAEDVETYTSISAIASSLRVREADITAEYNENSEKYLSISASKSNCFNILQTIAETFEGWIDLVVKHDERGYITSTNGKLDKYVYFREYIGTENWAGFKYGINLNTIERTVNSDEFVTKLIVDQSQSDLVDEGYVSIALAPSNISGEAYILNFDYYYNQGLLDRDNAEADRLKFITEISEINNILNEKEQKRRDLENSLTDLTSKRNVYTELVTKAQDNKSQALERFQTLAHMTYEQYQQVHTSRPSEQQLTEEETLAAVMGELYTTSSVINSYSGLLTTIEQEYWKVRKELRGSENFNVKVWVARDSSQARHIFIELNDYLPGFSFDLGNNVTDTSTVSKKYFDVVSNSTTITFTAPNGYTISPSTYTINDEREIKANIISSNTFIGVEDEIEDLIEQKSKLIKQFENKYSRFIQEGTWSSTEYIDSELYYLDALQVSNTSAQPTVSYSINVVEISQLEGFEHYNFNVGDKTYIEDTEFFGWAKVHGNLTPAREEVVVSEVEWHLDSPDQNVITVQNYKTRFEDLFQRISATVQTVQYNEATYAKTSSLIDRDGTINQNVLLDSLNNISGKKYNLTSDGSVLIDGDQIIVQNLTNPSNRVKISSEGISISSNGGESWTTTIDGQGINISTVYTGMLNTNEIIIGNKENPSFRWDKSGISAYKQQEPTRAVSEPPYDLQTFVRYDQWGLYGIKDNGSFRAQNLQDVKDKAHFAVTWDGFFIKNSYTNGWVEITTDNDFRVMQKLQDGDQSENEHERIKIGALEFDQFGNPAKYGININQSIYNSNTGQWEDMPAFTTGSDGNITITGTINATGGNFTGIVNVGLTNQDHIIIDGIDASISTSTYNDGANIGWIINKDGDAIFNNITARGAIKTAVFEYAEIQAVGGIFIFRPSSNIKAARPGNIDQGENATDLIIKVDKPQLFYKRVYNRTNDTTVVSGTTYYSKQSFGYQEEVNPSGDPKSKGWYVCDTESSNSWCKISNYTNGEPQIENLLFTNGLTHVYKISNIKTATSELVFEQGMNLINAIRIGTQTDEEVCATLVGGAVIDMGRVDGSTNYGIGINSSDNTVNLPARSISLFETVINPNLQVTPRVTYNYKGVLGTLPHLEYTGLTPIVSQLYHDYLEDTQGLFTNNIYIGNNDQYLAFYTDENGDKHLKINAQEIVFGYEGDREITWNDKIEQVTTSNTYVQISSSAGETFVSGVINTILTCKVYSGTTDITSTISSFSWDVRDEEGNSVIGTQSQLGDQYTINVSGKAKIVAKCTIEV